MWSRAVPILAAGALLACTESAAQQPAYVASSKGRVYYWTAPACKAWKRLSPRNLVRFESAAAAERAGYRPSAANGCVPPRPAAEPVRLTRGEKGERCIIERIVDGDTFQCSPVGRVRMLLIDTPELGQGDIGSEARRVLSALLPVGDTVELELDVAPRDRYQRTLAYVYRDGIMVNRELARRGVAVAAVYPPNVRHVELIRAAVDSARAERAGLWARSAFECTPADYRAKRCGR